jgi:hypothetical protein
MSFSALFQSECDPVEPHDSNIPLSVALVATKIGFCSNTFHGKPDENHWSCGICPNYIVPPSEPHIDSPKSP